MNTPERDVRQPLLHWLPVLSVLVLLIPLAFARDAFTPLFYFQDEWELLDRWSRDGFATWVLAPFGESPMPVFKFLWAGLVTIGGGNYHVLLAGLWFVHALNTFLIARLVLNSGGGVFAAGVAIVMCGFSGTTWETLQWSIQLSAVLAITGLLAALSSRSLSANGKNAGAILVAFTASVLAGLCFARGVAVGPAIAAAVLFSSRPLRERAATAIAAIIPSLVIGAWIATQSLGKSGAEISLALEPAAKFALMAFAQNPACALAGGGMPSMAGATLLALAKIALFAWAYLAVRRARPWIAALFLFEILNAVMLGIGRHHTGIETAGSSRYQYASLFTTVPPFALLVGLLLARLREAPRRVVATALAGTLLVVVLKPWQGPDAGWLAREGSLTRARLAGTAAPGPYPHPLSNVEWIDDSRAIELGREFDLK